MIDWSKSYTSTWRVFRVNRKTWADGEMLKKVDSASVSRTADGRVLESGSLEVSGEFESDYYRIVMTAQQGGELARVDVATLLFEVKGGQIDFGRTVHSVDGYSVLYPAETTAITIGEYAPAGVDGAQYAKELLESAINAPVEVEGGFTLNDHVVHELGSSVIDAVWAVLDAAPNGGYVIQIDGKGVVHIRPKPTEPTLKINSRSVRLLTNGIEYSSDTSEIPNRYVVIDDSNVVIASNDDPDSKVSTVSRGYFVDMVDTSPTPINGQTLSEYANDRLKALSVLKEEHTYVREYADKVYLYSLVRASINGLQGDLRVESQSINCGKGITVTEKASKEIALW
nr:hypothetical protein [Clostridia bacterium]